MVEIAIERLDKLNKIIINSYNEIDKLKAEKDKYKQCLDEIEEKVKNLCKRCVLDFKAEDINSIPNEEYCDDAVCYFILKKIKEVKGNE